MDHKQQRRPQVPMLLSLLTYMHFIRVHKKKGGGAWCCMPRESHTMNVGLHTKIAVGRVTGSENQR